MSDKDCVIDKALTLLPAGLDRQSEDSCRILNRIKRLLVEIKEGKGTPGHLTALKSLARDLNLTGETVEPVGLSLLALIEENRGSFLEHMVDKRCSSGVCFDYHPAPCQSACPAYIDIPTFVALIGQGRYEEATDVILQDNPFPWTCGLICPHPCEDACLRGEQDKSISIQLMKAYTAKITAAANGYRKSTVKDKKPEKIAVIGSGPAGLSAAYFLARKGYQVTIFEKRPLAGGMLRYGIPAYRLPKDILDIEIDNIKGLGVEIRTEICFGEDITLKSLKSEGFNAFYLAVGLNSSHAMGLKGENLEGILGGIDFLRAVAQGDNPNIGKKVIVVGGGNAAIDVARTIVRLGADEVTIIYRRTRKEMPAWEEEICAAEDEGIQIIHLAAPQKIINKNDKISALRVMKMELKEPDASGRRRPVPILGSEYDIEIDQLISAIGQEADTDAAAAEQIELGRFNNIKADMITGETNLSGVFAGGDVVYGPRMVVDAVAAGKRASVAIDCYLQKKPVPNPIVRPRSRGSVPFLDLTAQEKVDLKRPHPGQVPVEDRVKNFHQVDLDLTQDMAVNEAKRCLRCDRCRGDGLCMFACTEMGINALTLNSTKKERLAFFDFSGTDEKCIGCGSCAGACPHDNIVVNDDAGKRKIFFCGTLIAEFDLEPCERCGTPFAPKAYLDLIKKRADSAAGADIERKLCPDCARAVRAERIAGEFSSF